jgi:hypothetical protein
MVNQGKGESGLVVLQHVFAENRLAIVLLCRRDILLTQGHVGSWLHGDGQIASRNQLQDLWW